MIRSVAEHVRLRWVEVNGEIVHVQTLAHLPPRKRPIARCPVCEREVTLKLGRVKVPHYAHQPEDECAASGGESAVHLNTKFHLLHVLRGLHALRVRDKCAASKTWHGCAEVRSAVWVDAWDAVEVEKGLGSRRPDLTLYRGGEPIAAVEVFATHSVDDEKRADLAALGLPWIEVRAEPALYEGAGWDGTVPLDVRARQPAPEPWHCPPHEAERQEAERLRASRTLYLLICDYYYPSGGHYRDVFRIHAYMPDGAHAETVWVDSTATRKFRAEDPQPDRARTLPLLQGRVAAWIEAKRRHGVVVDSPMRWVKPAALPDPNLLSFAAYPARYRWAPSRKSWFMPAALRAVRWCAGPQVNAGATPQWWPLRTLDVRDLVYPPRAPTWDDFKADPA